MTLWRDLGLVVAAVIVMSCAQAVPTAPVLPPSPSLSGIVASPEPSPTTTRTSPPPASSPAPVEQPPYSLERGGLVLQQEPGSIVFGQLQGDLEDARLEARVSWPDGGLTLDAVVAFGAYWGEPIEASSVRFTLYRVADGTLDRVWTDEKTIDPAATGYLDELVPFEAPGTYRLEATRDDSLLACGLAYMGPPCESDCSGG